MFFTYSFLHLFSFKCILGFIIEIDCKLLRGRNRTLVTVYSLASDIWHRICHIVSIQQIFVEISISKKLKIAIQMAETKLKFKLILE